MAVPMSRMMPEASGRERGKRCLKPAAIPENRRNVKEHCPPPFSAVRARPGLTFLSEGLVAFCLDATEQLSSLHAVTHTFKKEDKKKKKKRLDDCRKI